MTGQCDDAAAAERHSATSYSFLPRITLPRRVTSLGLYVSIYFDITAGLVVPARGGWPHVAIIKFCRANH